ncbi:UDP-glucose 6-dehydrogenase, partial [bacterium]
IQGVSIAQNQYEAAKGADALVICTEWAEFRSPDFDELRQKMRGNLIFDGRNLFSPAYCAAEGFAYHSIGRPFVEPAAK